MIATIVMVVAAAVIALVVAPRDERVSPALQPSTTATRHMPAFAFAVGRSGALPTAAIKGPRSVRSDPLLRLRGASKVASDRAIASITRLYRAAFLDPGNWSSGTYDAVWEDFGNAVRSQARKDVRALTAGSAAGDAYAGIVPRRSTITTTVLLDRKGQPAVVLVATRFEAFGRTVSGSANTRFESTGRFFFERSGGDWTIVSYDVRRHDRRVAKTMPGPSAGSVPSPAEAT